MILDKILAFFVFFLVVMVILAYTVPTLNDFKYPLVVIGLIISLFAMFRTVEKNK